MEPYGVPGVGIAVINDYQIEWAKGYGVLQAGEGQGFRFSHTGGTWGSTCILWAHPKTGQGAVVMTNSASGAGAIRFEILVSIAAEHGWPSAEAE
jgi:hypothetical protein